MGSKEFIEKCKEIVKEYTLEHLDKSDDVPNFEVFDVWYCKTLQNYKEKVGMEKEFILKCRNQMNIQK